MSNGTGYKFFSGLLGSKLVTCGGEDAVFQYQPDELQEAIDATPAFGCLILEPRTYTVTTPLEVYKPMTIMCLGEQGGAIITSALATDTMLINVPAEAGTMTLVSVKFRNVTITNSHTGDAVHIDNDGGATLPLAVDFQNCSITNSSTGLALNVAQTEATTAEYINIAGRLPEDRLGKTYVAAVLAGDEFNVYGMYCTSTIELDTTDVVAISNIISCIYTSQAFLTGSAATRLDNAVGNFYDATSFGGAISKGAAGDFDGSGSDNVIIFG